MKHLLLAALALLPLSAVAEEIGRITATLNGEQHTWYALAASTEHKHGATATLRDSDHISDLSINGQSALELSNRRRLALVFSYDGPFAPDKPFRKVEVLYVVDGFSEPFYTNHETAVPTVAQIDSFRRSGGRAHVTGRITAKICKTRQLYSPTDPDDCLDLDGTFDTALALQ